MKAHLAKVSLALLSAVFLLGCQEQGSEPVGPEGLGPQFAAKKCTADPTLPGCGGDDGDDGDPAATTLTLADGMQTPSDPLDDDPLPVTVNQDSPKRLNVGNSDFVHDIQMNFMKPEPGTCVEIKAVNGSVALSAGEIAKLEAELTEPVTDGSFIMKIDKTSLGSPSDGNLLLVERDGTFEGPNGHTRIMLGSPFDEVDPVKVTQPDLNVDVFEFTGPVVVWAHGVGGGGVKSNRIIQCGGAGDNKVTATLNNR